jgi:hypothetical protein
MFLWDFLTGALLLCTLIMFHGVFSWTFVPAINVFNDLLNDPRNILILKYDNGTASFCLFVFSFHIAIAAFCIFIRSRFLPISSISNIISIFFAPAFLIYVFYVFAGLIVVCATFLSQKRFQPYVLNDFIISVCYSNFILILCNSLVLLIGGIIGWKIIDWH